jgi:hypothetical protein
LVDTACNMKPLFTFSFAVLLYACTGCKHDTRTSYAIRDFSKTLQPYLVTVVSEGVVGYDTATRFILIHATDEDLKLLSQSEHPVLRALAFREMLHRPTFDHYNLIMTHLDDTAIVSIDDGEWGIRYRRVSDEILQNGRWKDTSARKKTIDEVVLKHNYLSSAYGKLARLERKEVYYTSIKAMSQSERSFCDYFYDIEQAQYALAAYRKKEDIPAIRQFLSSNVSRLSEFSFALMQYYPNETYLDIYERYYPRYFYRKLCRDQKTDDAISFIKSVAVYKNDRSEKILSSILNRKPFMPCATDTGTLKMELMYAIWNNPCIAYSKIRSQVESSIKKDEEDNREKEIKYKNQTDSLIPEVDSSYLPKNVLTEPIWWW